MLGNIQMKKNGLVKPIQLLKVENGLLCWGCSRLLQGLPTGSLLYGIH